MMPIDIIEIGTLLSRTFRWLALAALLLGFLISPQGTTNFLVGQSVGRGVNLTSELVKGIANLECQAQQENLFAPVDIQCEQLPVEEQDG